MNCAPIIRLKIIVGVAGQNCLIVTPKRRPSNACDKFESEIGKARTASVVAGCITPLRAGTAIRGVFDTEDALRRPFDEKCNHDKRQI